MRGERRALKQTAKALSPCAASALLALFVLFPAFDNGLVSDDWVFVYAGGAAEGPRDLLARVPDHWFSRPMVWLLAYAMTHSFGMDPLPYRLLGATVHSLNALLLGGLGWRMYERWGHREAGPDPWRGGRILAFGAGGLFFCYSLSHEVLYWFSAIPEALALLFRLGALLILLDGLDGDGGRPRRLSLRIPAIAALTAAALASKESAVVIPLELALLLVVDRWNEARRGRPWRERRALWTGAAAIAAAAAVTAAWLLRYLETGVTRGDLTLFELGPVAWGLRLGQAAWRAVAFGAILDSAASVSLLWAVAALSLLAAFRRRRPLVAFAVPWLALCLLPYAGITSLGDREAAVPALWRMAILAEDRCYYGAGAAVALLTAAVVVWGVGEVTPRLAPGAWRRAAVRTAVCGLLILGGAHALRLRAFESQWDRAGDIVTAARAELGDKLAAPIRPGEVVCVAHRPDNYRGRFVLRSGIKELIFLTAGHEELTVLVPPLSAEAPCTRRLRLEAGADAARVE